MMMLNHFICVELLNEEIKSEGGIFIKESIPTNVVRVKVIESNDDQIKVGTTAWVPKNLIQMKTDKTGFIDGEKIYAMD